ncbi:MAG: DUF86 domain-containing protein [Desulfobacterota bacterium]|jgi:uncharacterized protein YutE (UPF0331/DUF86 family)|nr:DUF86 domain-containing protein [Thermodesulfobacteriota bacterium]
MTPGLLREKVIAERSGWIREMLDRINALPLESYEQFTGDLRNVGAAESYLRRALEALLDLGRHILAKGFGLAVPEYKEIAQKLTAQGILNEADGSLLEKMAGYRNRMVHYYQEISGRELYEICTRKQGDLEALLAALLKWLNAHPEKIDRSV